MLSGKIPSCDTEVSDSATRILFTIKGKMFNKNKTKQKQKTSNLVRAENEFFRILSDLYTSSELNQDD